MDAIMDHRSFQTVGEEKFRNVERLHQDIDESLTQKVREIARLSPDLTATGLFPARQVIQVIIAGVLVVNTKA